MAEHRSGWGFDGLARATKRLLVRGLPGDDIDPWMDPALLERACSLSGIGAWELDLDTMRVRSSRQASYVLDLRAGDELDFDAMLEMFRPEARARVLDEVRGSVEDDPPWSLELPLTTRLGRFLWVRLIGERIGSIVRGSVQDVTDRHALQAASERSNTVLRNVVDHMPCGLAVYNTDQTLVVVNEQFRRLVGSPDDLFESHQPRFRDLIAFNLARGDFGQGPQAQVLVEQFLAFATSPVESTFERVRPDGTTLAWRAAPLPGGGFILTCLDMTERRQIEAEVKRSDALLRGAMEAIDEAFALFDPDDRLVFCNEKGRQVYGNVADLLQPGVRFEDILRAMVDRNARHLHRDEGEAWVVERIAQHQRCESTVSRQVSSDGQSRWMRVIERRMPDGHIAGFHIDISDLVRATETAEKASLAKSQFLANMSHEIRTPMNAVLGMLKLLHKTTLTPRQQDYVGKTEGAARSLLGLLNDILDFSKVEAGKMALDPHPMRIDELLRNLSVILAGNVGRKNIEVLFDIDPQLPRRVIGDAMRLQQVLINLAGNAIKFTQVGEVVLQIRVEALAPDAVTLMVSVRDTGIGIAPEHQQRIFTGFSQAEASTSRRFGGTGLGLAISQRLVQLMGGNLELESEPGRGSRFFFRLRLDLPLESSPDDAETTARLRAPETPLRALLVDDNASAREALSTMGSTLGWDVDTADSGASALQRVRDAADAGHPYQVVLVDWVMPGMDGWQTSRELRSMTQGNTPLVVMVTAHGREMLAQRSETEHGLLDGFLVKPVTASMLFDAVSDARASSSNGTEDSHPQPAASAVKRRLAGLRLLVVEDNLNNQQVARELLEDEGAAVLLAGDGQQALTLLAQAKRGPPRIDAVLMDVQMPIMDGFTATRLIRRQLGLTLPIIAMTANALPADAQACLDVGMSEHVGKPFDVDQLVAVLLRHCGLSYGLDHGLSDRPAQPSATRVELPQGLLNQARAQGIELAEALGRLSGKIELFSRMVVALRASADALPPSSDPQYGASLHSLRGLAATLGARELADLAGEGERTLQAGAALPADWPERWQALKQSQLQALSDLSEALRAGDAAPPPADGYANEQLAPRLSELIDLLEGSDMAALEQYATLRGNVREHWPGSAELLESALDGLDFAGAAGHCRALLRGVRQ